MVPKRAFELRLMPRFLYSHNVQSIPKDSYPTPDSGCRLGGETNVETALACSGNSIILVIMSLGPPCTLGHLQFSMTPNCEWQKIGGANSDPLKSPHHC